jgi:hypothetical protein
VTAAVLAALERRRPAFDAWSTDVEAQLLAAAEGTLAQMGRQFAEIAADPAYWTRVESVVRGVVVPRYLQVAKPQHALERSGYGLWRGGDLVSRAGYGALGLVLALIIWRAAFVPKWLELLPVALVLFGPLIPDLQISTSKRRYGKALDGIVSAMSEEQSHRDAYQPLSESPEELPPVHSPTKERT